MCSYSSRRHFLRGLATLPVVGFAGCSALAPKQRLMITVLNNTETPHVLELRVYDNNDNTLVRQYFKLPASPPNRFTEIETVVSLGRVSRGKRVNVQATLDEDRGARADVPLILDCISENGGNAVVARIQNDAVRLSDDLDGNTCFSRTSTGADDSNWYNNGTNS